MAKTRTYSKLRIPAATLAHRILNHLSEIGFEVAYSYDESKKRWAIIQARKASTLRKAIGQRRTLQVQLHKTKDGVKITIGTGDWGKNTIMSAAPMLVFPTLGFINFISSALSSKFTEADLWAYIDEVATQY